MLRLVVCQEKKNALKIEESMGIPQNITKREKKFDRNRNSYGREFCGACWLKGNNFQKEDQGWQTSLYN